MLPKHIQESDKARRVWCAGCYFIRRRWEILWSNHEWAFVISPDVLVVVHGFLYLAVNKWMNEGEVCCQYFFIVKSAFYSFLLFFFFFFSFSFLLLWRISQHWNVERGSEDDVSGRLWGICHSTASCLRWCQQLFCLVLMEGCGLYPKFCLRNGKEHAEVGWVHS